MAICPECGGPRDHRARRCRSCHDARDKVAKTCARCRRTFPAEAFNWRPNGRGGHKRRSRCRECEAAEARARMAAMTPARRRAAAAVKRKWEKENPEKYQRQQLRRAAVVAGVDPAVVEQHLEACGGRCEICGRTPDEAGQKRLAVDHCHGSGAFRGLLCNRCNVMLGHAQDQPHRLIAGAAYLQRAATEPVGRP